MENNILNTPAVSLPEVILPKLDSKEEWQRWAVIACDQFTSQPEYWEEAGKIAGESPSALKLILPEVYLEAEDSEERIKKINHTMRDYLGNGTLEEPEKMAVLVERTTAAGTRRGLMVKLDLEAYDYGKDSLSLIRATEGTVEERIPPRMKVREKAALELPHVLVLIDDPKKTIIEPLAECPGRVLYDFDLMCGGGHITGLRITDEPALTRAMEGLNNLKLLAVGDGNHSLASAKCHWERLKKEGAAPDHPARYAMAEIENIHDPAIVFEPIHRVLFGVNPYLFFDELAAFYQDKAGIMEMAPDLEALPHYEGCHTVGYMSPGHNGMMFIDKAVHQLAAGALQVFLDDYISKHPECKIDYVHGLEALKELSKVSGNMGFYLPPIDKNGFFEAIIKNGSMPRKTFSMGEAWEKRYYIEARRIV